MDLVRGDSVGDVAAMTAAPSRASRRRVYDFAPVPLSGRTRPAIQQNHCFQESFRGARSRAVDREKSRGRPTIPSNNRRRAKRHPAVVRMTPPLPRARPGSVRGQHHATQLRGQSVYDVAAVAASFGTVALAGSGGRRSPCPGPGLTYSKRGPLVKITVLAAVPRPMSRAGPSVAMARGRPVITVSWIAANGYAATGRAGVDRQPRNPQLTFTETECDEAPTPGCPDAHQAVGNELDELAK
jgi:hypothetical protein